MGMIIPYNPEIDIPMTLQKAKLILKKRQIYLGVFN